MRSSSKKPLNLRAQKLLLDQCFPEAACTIKGRTLIWEGKIRPSVVSCFYQIRIIYTLGEPPDVFVLSPDLQTVSDATKPGRGTHLKDHLHPNLETAFSDYLYL
jgi:hypothetical protein